MRKIRKALLAQGIFIITIPLLIGYVSTARDLEIQRVSSAQFNTITDQLLAEAKLSPEMAAELRRGLMDSFSTMVNESISKTHALDLIQLSCLMAALVSFWILFLLRHQINSREEGMRPRKSSPDVTKPWYDPGT